jgi:2-polyprenyl-6-methoxyphenol hydroxylase-like FAD-dependent oxidoreductase
VGGSIAGLFTGILLKRQGHNIRILESASSSAREGQAAGIGLAEHVRAFFDNHDRLAHVPLGIPNSIYEISGPKMQSMKSFPVSLRMTSWDAVYYRLRANYDGMKSPYCPEQPAMEESEGTGVFETGVRVLKVADLGTRVSVTCRNVSTGEDYLEEADFVIAADGGNSSIRRQLHPDIKRDEPGYLLWRGTTPVKDVSAKVLERVDGKAVMIPMERMYIVMYVDQKL